MKKGDFFIKKKKKQQHFIFRKDYGEKTQQACSIKCSRKRQGMENRDKFTILQMTRILIFLTLKYFILYSDININFSFFCKIL